MSKRKKRNTPQSWWPANIVGFIVIAPAAVFVFLPIYLLGLLGTFRDWLFRYCSMCEQYKSQCACQAIQQSGGNS